jgi:hypothetical protein
MHRTQVTQSHRPNHDEPAEREQPELPVEPDEGLIPPRIPEDPEHDRLIDPAAVRPEEGLRRENASRSAPGLPLPHERDESPGGAGAAPDPVIAQAKRDIDAGMVDTDMHATPGLDAKLRARLVPGPGGKPPSGSATLASAAAQAPTAAHTSKVPL